MVHVSMNLTDYTVTPISKVFDAISKEATSKGVEIAEGELIGLIPLDAVCDLASSFLKMPGFTSNQVLERRIWG
jgi:glutamate formiminotransferase